MQFNTAPGKNMWFGSKLSYVPTLWTGQDWVMSITVWSLYFCAKAHQYISD